MTPPIATEHVPMVATPVAVKTLDSTGYPVAHGQAKRTQESAQVAKEDYNGNYVFAPIKEWQTSRAMTSRYFKSMHDATISDVIIVGCGSAGATCCYTLAKARPDLRITVLEASVSPGGGCWLGGQLMTPMVVRKPANLFLDEIEVAYEDEGDFVVVKHAALFMSTLMSKMLALPNVTMFNATCAEDLIVKQDRDGVSRVNGVVTNWTLVTLNHMTQSCMDPNTMTAPVVCTFTGHDGPFGAFSVKRLGALGLREIKDMGALDMNKSETLVTNNTREVFPGMICGGMELAELDGLPRMGASFGGMIASGRKAAKEAAQVFDSLEVVDGDVIGAKQQ